MSVNECCFDILALSVFLLCIPAIERWANRLRRWYRVIAQREEKRRVSKLRAWVNRPRQIYVGEEVIQWRP